MNRSTITAVLVALSLAACGDGRDSSSRDGAPRSAPAAGEAGTREARSRAAAAAAAEPAGDTPIEITARVGGREVAAKGLGACEHAADGSIYDRPASLWAARFDGGEGEDVRHLSLTFWRERSGTESVTMSLQVSSDVHRIATVEGGGKQGSGTAALEGDAAAGTLTVKGTSAEGEAVEVRARCSR
ncbi:MAG TPA: hypothetical protein VEB59_10570, partial [Gemmatimonadales bacterium]|nr:hypothetical protein [Gemmatimonadales bacterium]